MAQLLEKYRIEGAKQGQMERASCLRLVQRLKKIVLNQEDINEDFEEFECYPVYDRYKVKYCTECDELKSFMNVVNNDPYGKMKIEIVNNAKLVEYITTNVDVDNDLVTYKLGSYNGLDQLGPSELN